MNTGSYHSNYPTYHAATGGPPPPPPPPPSGGPPPPPPPGGGPPPPKGGPLKPPGGFAKKAADKAVSEMSVAERNAWIGKLTFNNVYPDDPKWLMDKGFAKPSTVQSKTIPEGNKAAHAQESKEYYQAQVTALLNNLYAYPEEIRAPFQKEIDDTLTKLTKDRRGLVGCQEQLIRWNSLLELRQKQDAEFSEEYTSASKLQSKYDELSQEFQQLRDRLKGIDNESDKGFAMEALQTLRQQMQDLVGKLKVARDGITVHKAVVESNQADFESKYSSAMTPIRANIQKIEQLQSEIENKRKRAGNLILDPSGNIQNQVSALEKALQTEKAKTATLKEEFSDKMPDIQAAEDKYKRTLATFNTQMARRALFEEPNNWKSIKNVKISSDAEQKKGSAQEDPEFSRCMEVEGTKREFNIRFLSASQQARLAWFFASEEKDVDDLLPVNREQQRLLMTTIEQRLNLIPDLNFKMLMDIAEGKLKRSEGQWAGFSSNDFLNHIITDDNISPNYDELERQYFQHTSHKDFQKDDKKKASIKQNQERGITFQANGKKTYDFKRKIDLSYLNENQLDRLARFFERHANEFRTEDTINFDTLSSRVQNILNVTNLSFETLTDIAQGHLTRNGGKFAPDDFAVLAEDVTRADAQPNYEAAVQQRTDYYERKVEEEAERRRQEQAAREEAKLAAEEEKRVAQEEKEAEAIEKTQALIEGFRELIPEPDFTNPKVVRAFKSYLQDEIKTIEDPILRESVDKKINAHLDTLNPQESKLEVASDEKNEKIDIPPIPSPQPPKQNAKGPLTFSSNPAPSQAPQPPSGSASAPGKSPAAAPQLNSFGLEAELFQSLRETNSPSTWEADVAKNVDSRLKKGSYYSTLLLFQPDKVNMQDMIQHATINIKYWGRTWQRTANYFGQSGYNNDLALIQRLAIELNLDLPDDPSERTKRIDNRLIKAQGKNPQNPHEIALYKEIKSSAGLSGFLYDQQTDPKSSGLNKLAVLKGCILDALNRNGYTRDDQSHDFSSVCQHLLMNIDAIAGGKYDVLKNDPSNDGACLAKFKAYKDQRDIFLTSEYKASASPAKKGM